MHKLKLSLDNLDVETFEPVSTQAAFNGTVHGNSGLPSCLNHTECGSCGATCATVCEECNTLHVTYCQEGCDTLTVLPTGYTCNAGDYTCPPMKGCVVTG